jgi:hypothetical protein
MQLELGLKPTPNFFFKDKKYDLIIITSLLRKELHQNLYLYFSF